MMGDYYEYRRRHQKISFSQPETPVQDAVGFVGYCLYLLIVAAVALTLMVIGWYVMVSAVWLVVKCFLPVSADMFRPF